jgi:hypothetical protein
MERKYLAATLAMAATFMVFSQAFSSGFSGRLLRQPRATLLAELKCATRALSTRLLDKISPALRPDSPEEAQLLAELNLPALVGQVRQAELPQIAPVAPAPPVEPIAAITSDCPEARRARERAAREADRAQREMERVQRQMERQQQRLEKTQAKWQLHAGNIQVSLPENFDQQLQINVMSMQRHIAEQTMQTQIAAHALAQAQIKISKMKLKNFNYGAMQTQGIEESHRIACPAALSSSQSKTIDRLSNRFVQKVTRMFDSTFSSL